MVIKTVGNWLKNAALRVIAHGAVWLGLYLISLGLAWFVQSLGGRSLYIMEWTTKNLYWNFWTVPLVLAFFGGNIWAWAITGGNVLGVVLGQTLGEYLQYLRYLEDPSLLSGFHMGFQTWFLCVFLGFAAGFAAQVIRALAKVWRDED